MPWMVVSQGYLEVMGGEGGNTSSCGSMSALLLLLSACDANLVRYP